MTKKTSERRVSRRSFLDQVGRAGGSAAVYRSMTAMGLLAASSAKAEAFSLSGARPSAKGHDCPSRHRSPSNRARVVIVGAGIAGMTAAYELSRAGYRCTILEGRRKAGGRCETLRRGSVVDEADREQHCHFSHGKHLYYNSGPARIPFHHQGVLNYCKHFDIELETFTNDNRAAYFYDPNKLGNAPIRGLEVHTNMRGHIAELLSKALNKGALDEELGSEDQERLLAMLQEFGDLKEGKFVGSGRAGYLDGFNLGQGASDALAARELSALLEADFWTFRYNFPQLGSQTPTLLQPVGGMSKIAEAFERRTHRMIRLGCKVSGIFNRDSGVQVNYCDPWGQERTMEADYAIVTTSAPLLLEMDSNLSGEHLDAMAGLKYTRAGKLAFQAPRFWENKYQIYGGISWTTEDITQLWYPAHDFQKRNGIIGGAYIWDDEPGEKFAGLSNRERIEMGKRQGSKIHPEYAERVSRGISRSWYNTDWVRGGWRDGPPNPLLNEPDGRVYFAGEHINALAGWQEGSIISAQDAASKIHAREGQTASARSSSRRRGRARRRWPW